MRVGIDVGGTNTDAVLLHRGDVVAKTKTATTEEITTGIEQAMEAVLGADGVTPEQLDAVMIGTTHFTNAVVQRRELSPVAVVRLARPATVSLPPMVDWPDELREVVEGSTHVVHGGSEFDGRPISAVRTDELDEVVAAIRRRGLRTAAVTSVFSPVDPSTEERVAHYLRERVPGLTVTCSHAIGRIGLLERENAAILNASLQVLADRTVAELRAAIRTLQVDVPVFLTQNDGTLMGEDVVARFPVLTFSSGPTNSMRGAGFLTGIEDALVVDVGGTTSDVGALARGFPRDAALAVDVGGVRTNFRMPDVHAIGLGGGTIIRTTPDGEVRIGPDSVGYRLTERARVFGGDTLTATDIAVAAGDASLGDPARVADLDPDLVATARRTMQTMLDVAVDRVRLSRDPLPVVVVGGGRILVSRPVAGASRMVVPEHHEVANAIGAANAQVSGEVEHVVSLADTSRDQALRTATDEAVERAVRAGADPPTIEVLDSEDVPLAYLPGNAARIHVKVVGDLRALTPEKGHDRAPAH